MGDSDGPEALQKVLKVRRISAAKAARELGVTSATLHYWLTGAQRPRPVHQEQLEIWSDGDVPREIWLTAAERTRLDEARARARAAASGSTEPEAAA